MSSSFSFLSEDVSSSAVDLTLLIIRGLLQTCSHYRLFRGLFETCNANIDLRLVRAPCSMYGLIITVVITIDPQLGDEPTACLFFSLPPRRSGVLILNYHRSQDLNFLRERRRESKRQFRKAQLDGRTDHKMAVCRGKVSCTQRTCDYWRHTLQLTT
jgi:hypothetical protein